MLKKIYAAVTAVLMCVALSVSVSASESDPPSEAVVTNDTALPAEGSAVSEAYGGEHGETMISAPPYNPEEAVVTAAESEYSAYTEEPAQGPIEEPAKNDTAPSDTEPVGSIFGTYDVGTGDIENILEYWEANGYPEDVSYAADNSIAQYTVATQTETVYYLWNIGVVNADEARKREICALISDKYRVMFTDCEYSHKQRAAVAEKIRAIYPLAETELGYGCQDIWVYLDKYSDDEKEKIENDILWEFNTAGSGDLVYVLSTSMTSEPETAVAIDALPETEEVVPPAATFAAPPEVVEAPSLETGVDASGYEGGAVWTSEETAVVSNEDGYAGALSPINDNDHDAAPTVAQAEAEEEESAGIIGVSGEVAAVIADNAKPDNGLWIWLCSAAAAVIAIAAALVIGRSRRSESLSLAEGGETRPSGKLGRADIVKAVKESETEPSDRVFEEIRDRISGEKK
ncbi:MAG: hypothetical protein NC394_10280 [Bacteroides sp.]|nr:hypothetical protein [Bacteroides sp.]